MFNINNTGSGEKRNTVPFPVSTAVDNVLLHLAEPNENIPAIKFTFKRIQDGLELTPGTAPVDTISFLTDSVLLPKKEYCQGGRLKDDGSVETPEEHYAKEERVFMGYIRKIATACGVTKEQLSEIPAVESFDQFADEFCKVVNKYKGNDPVYLKTVKDKNGYTKLPKYRGKGVIQPMTDGLPLFTYSDYELQMIEAAGATGVVEEEPTKISVSSIDDLE